MTGKVFAIRKYKPGSVVIVQGSDNPGMVYVVKSGSLTLDSEHRLNDRALSGFQPGDSFGLVSALTSKKYLVSIYAQTEVELIEIPIENMGIFLKEKPDFAIKIFRVYSRELKALNRYLSSRGPADDDKDAERHLLGDALTYLKWGRNDYAAHALLNYTGYCEKINDMEGVAKGKSLLEKNNLKPEVLQWPENSMKVKAGKVLFLENEGSEDIYVIQSGSVRLFNIVRNKEYVVDILGPGEIFGEMALLEQSCRSGSAVTETDSELMRLSKNTLFQEVGQVVLQKIAEGLARRIWFNHQRLVILRIKEPVTRLYAFLYNQIREETIQKKCFGSGFGIEDKYTFPITFQELQIMCGLIRVNPETLKPFVNDKVIEINPKSITILNARAIKDKVTYLRGSSGQISADLL